ncbi:alpha/beta hydrolase [Agrilactobacillus fermenti]|uniref:alpha/beta hydrolase n=1 Tax=Agrilactobacillus fermenti TaxID=2586909 RepID=UPI003A5C2871
MKTNDINYEFVQGSAHVAPLLLLHGTGGDEKDLLPIGHFLSPEASLLSIRGRLIENGLTRYFKHTATGGFDLDSLTQETNWLFNAIKTLTNEHGLSISEMIVVGYSNGANVAAKAILAGISPIKTGIFFHPMVLAANEATPAITDTKVWLSHGNQDPIVSPANFNALKTMFQKQQADMTAYEANQSHNLSENELEAAKAWLSTSGRI